MSNLYNALIRTHHITSRKKVTKLRQAANLHSVYVLIRYGGAPGVMYVEGSSQGVNDWVNVVQNLRYKDYQLVSRPAAVEHESLPAAGISKTGFHDSETVKDFGRQMENRGVYAWWRRAMGFTGSDDHL